MNNLVTAYGSASAVACGVGNAVRPSLGDEGNGNIAFGVRISVSGAGETTAVGFVNETGGVRNTVVGVHNITSGGNRNAVMGFANSAGSDAGVVIGESNFIQRDSDYSVAIGSGSDITGWNSIAIGNHATIGNWPTRERADNVIALGND